MPAPVERVENRHFLKATGSNRLRCHIRNQNSPFLLLRITEYKGDLLHLRCSVLVSLKLEHHSSDMLVILVSLQKTQTFL